MSESRLKSEQKSKRESEVKSERVERGIHESPSRKECVTAQAVSMREQTKGGTTCLRRWPHRPGYSYEVVDVLVRVLVLAASRMIVRVARWDTIGVEVGADLVPEMQVGFVGGGDEKFAVAAVGEEGITSAGNERREASEAERANAKGVRGFVGYNVGDPGVVYSISGLRVR